MIYIPDTISLRELDRSEHPVRNSGVDKVHVRRLAEVLESGSELPAILVGTVSKDPDHINRYVVDGWHRCAAFEKVHGPEVGIPAIEKEYDSWLELFSEAAAIAAESKLPLTPVDQARLVKKFADMGVPLEQVATILNVPAANLKSRTALSGPVGPAQGLAAVTQVALKRPFRHLEGKVLTTEQVAVNAKADGMDVRYHANQIISRLKVDGTIAWNGPTLKALVALREALVADTNVASYEDEAAA